MRALRASEADCARYAHAFRQAEMETACHWVKQVVSVVQGVVFGLMPLTGSTALLTYGAVTLLSTFITCSLLLRADLDLLGLDGQLELFKEGGMAAVATFMLAWIVTYTFAHA